jgi:hypothetical protein
VTVAELMGRLAQEDPEARVLLAKDAEGNRYAPLGKINAGAWVHETAGRIGFITVDDNDWRFLDAPPAICLWTW